MYITFSDLVDIGKAFNGVVTDNEMNDLLGIDPPLANDTFSSYKSGDRTPPDDIISNLLNWFRPDSRGSDESFKKLNDAILSIDRSGTAMLLPIMRIDADPKVDGKFLVDLPCVIDFESDRSFAQHDYQGYVTAFLNAVLHNTEMVNKWNKYHGFAGNLYDRIITFEDGASNFFPAGSKDTYRKDDFNKALQEMLMEHPFVILTGESGIGKTAFLHRAYQAKIGPKKKPFENVLINLKDADIAVSLIKSVRAPALLLIDGYNELPWDTQQPFIEEFFFKIKELTKMNDIRIIITDKSNGNEIASDIEHWEAVHHFQVATLQPISNAQVAEALNIDVSKDDSAVELLRIPLYLDIYKRLLKKAPDTLVSKYGVLDAYYHQLLDSQRGSANALMGKFVLALLAPYISYRMIWDNYALSSHIIQLRTYISDFMSDMADEQYRTQMIKAAFPGKLYKYYISELRDLALDIDALIEMLIQLGIVRQDADYFRFDHQEWRDYCAVRYALIYSMMLRLGDTSQWVQNHSFSIQIFDSRLMDFLESGLFSCAASAKNAQEISAAYAKLMPLDLAMEHIYANNVQELCYFFYFVGYDLWKRNVIDKAYEQYIYGLSDILESNIDNPNKSSSLRRIAPHFFTKQADLFQRKGQYKKCVDAASRALHTNSAYYPAMHQIAKAYLLYAKEVADDGWSADPDAHIAFEPQIEDTTQYVKALLTKAIEKLNACGENGYAASYNTLGLLYIYPDPSLKEYIAIDPSKAFNYFYQVTLQGRGHRWPESFIYACRQCASMLVEQKVRITIPCEKAQILSKEHIRSVTGDVQKIDDNSRKWAWYFLSNIRLTNDSYINYLNGVLSEAVDDFTRATQLYWRAYQLSNSQLMAIVRLCVLESKHPNEVHQIIDPTKVDLQAILSDNIRLFKSKGSKTRADQYNYSYTIDAANEMLLNNKLLHT